MNLYHIQAGARFYQGDVCKNVMVFEGWGNSPKQKTVYPYAALLTQECDLEQDWRAYIKIQESNSENQDERKSEDKILRHLIFAPCYVLAQFKEGTHVANRKMHKWNSGDIKSMRSNDKNIRFHYLPQDNEVQLPEFIIDFKHYFTVERDSIYSVAKSEVYICSLKPLFREDLSHRFAFYLSRIGLPEEDQREPTSATSVPIDSTGHPTSL